MSNFTNGYGLIYMISNISDLFAFKYSQKMKTCSILRGKVLGIENMILKYQSKKATNKIMFAVTKDENVFLK